MEFLYLKTRFSILKKAHFPSASLNPTGLRCCIYDCLSPLLLFGRLCWPLKEGGGGRIEKRCVRKRKGVHLTKSKLLRASRELGAKGEWRCLVESQIACICVAGTEPEPQMGQWTRKSNAPWNYLVVSYPRLCQSAQSSGPRRLNNLPRPPVSSLQLGKSL